MKKNILIILLFALSVNIHAGFWEGVTQFFQGIADFFSGNQTNNSITYDPPTPSDYSGTLGPVVRPCLAQVQHQDEVENLDEWHANGFENIEEALVLFDEDDYGTGQMTHEIDIESVVLRGSGWDAESVKERYAKVVEIYAGCGIRINQVKITTVDNPHPDPRVDGNYVDTLNPTIHPGGQGAGRAELRSLAGRFPSTHRPIVVFARDTGNNNAGFAQINNASAYNNYQNAYFPNSPSLNTAYIGTEVRGYGNITNASVVAHELGHILCQCHHVEGDESRLGVAPPGTDNLMNANPHSMRPTANNLTPQQCNLFKRSPMVKRIAEADRDIARREGPQ